MKNLLLTLGLLIVPMIAVADEPQIGENPIVAPANQPSLGELLQTVAVTIRAGKAHGSGVVFLKEDSEGNINTFILTAAHVVDGLRKQGPVLAPDGTTRQGVTFTDASIIRILVENGRKIGQIEIYGKIIRYSPIKGGEDLALLWVRSPNVFNLSAKLYDGIPPLGTELYHVGSMRGMIGANSLTDGILSQQGRILDDTVFDQTTVTAEPGSSGGLVASKQNGQIVGLLTQGIGQTFNFIVPARRIRTWSERVEVDWLFTDADMPKLEEVFAHQVDDNRLKK